MTSDWIDRSALADMLDESGRALLAPVKAAHMPRDTVLFRPGDAVRGFAIVLSGRVGVYLIGPGGRDILLYDITPGQTCVQSTLGILGHEDYSAEAHCETDCELALIPRDLFQHLLARSGPFRDFVFGAFARRLQEMMQLLEQVAFVRVEVRLATALLARADAGNMVLATHQELATQIGSAREVVSRRLDALAKRGFIRLDRGCVTLIDRAALQAFAENG
ncbi:MAG: Crp/Fnr family transcriptional regulator [Paracoccaceae bacterium]|nr:Crp/Fnr family transcriptional regulator [Paracoccaceae bacterium]